ncbi:MAG: hypothetical protein FWF52_05495 [Candidatus Azobacteroides sp.]|nr:hypothetical protein [Candidatus Azobacteroides sp.]
MNKLFFLGTLLFVAFGCNQSEGSRVSDENTFLTNLQTAPRVDVERESLPEWLVVKINGIEAAHGKDISIVKVRIFKGEWKEQTVYYIYDTLSSCGFCEVYYENGENVTWSANNISTNSFCSGSKNWELIYEYGKGLY